MKRADSLLRQNISGLQKDSKSNGKTIGWDGIFSKTGTQKEWFLLCQMKKIQSLFRHVAEKSIRSMLLKHKYMHFVDSGRKVRKSGFLDSIWKGNNHSKCKNKKALQKLEFSKPML